MGKLFAVIGLIVVAFAGYWWGVDRPGWSWGPCPVCIRVGPGSGVRLATLEAAAAHRASVIDAGAAAISTSAGAAQAQIQTKIKVVYRNIIKEIPNVITSKVNTDFPLSAGFVRVHDAAAQGFNLSDISNSATQSDDSASSVTASDAATIIANNYAKCTADDAQLSGLIAWVKDQQANWKANGSIAIHP